MSRAEYSDADVVLFLEESNMIEGINGIQNEEIDCFSEFLEQDELTVDDIRNYVAITAPGARIRNRSDMNVRVGNHHPPLGGAHVVRYLEDILIRANNGEDPYAIHQAYETLHPFMDGNGRSGRLIWAWQMVNQDIFPGLRCKFLQAWYYQSLEVRTLKDVRQRQA